jgi:hypothetical protein
MQRMPKVSGITDILSMVDSDAMCRANILRVSDSAEGLNMVYNKCSLFYRCISILSFLFQHANEDVEKMILGNKNDMDEKRVVSRERGEAVSILYHELIIYCARHY